jgi:hypothetical protein
MVKQLSIGDFNIDTNSIPQEVKDFYNSLSERRKTQLGKKFVSAYDFFIVLYHLRFVEKLEKSEIAEKMRIVNIHEHLYNFAWNYSHDYAENKILSEKESAKLKGDLAEAKEKSLSLDENENQNSKLKEALRKVKSIRNNLFLDLGFNTGEEYIRTIYYLIFIKHLSTPKLVRLFNITISSAHDRLRALGFHLNHEDGIKNKKEQKTQNYEVSLRGGKITRAKSQRKHFSIGSSKNEDYFRRQLSDIIYEGYIDSKKYEVIVGLNNIGILGTLEIDIPTIVYDVAKNQIHRFAIEYNAGYFHTNEEDMNKKALAESKGWHYLAILDKSKYSNNPDLLDPIVRETCEKIQKIIIGSNN